MTDDTPLTDRELRAKATEYDDIANRLFHPDLASTRQVFRRHAATFRELHTARLEIKQLREGNV